MLNNASMHSAQFMGLINALRTGDPTVDMIGAMLLPLLVQKAMTDLPRSIKTWLLRKEKNLRKTYTRTISFKSTNNNCGQQRSYNEDSYNMYLIRAIKLYMDKHCKLELEEGEIDLIAVDGTSSATMSGRRRGQGVGSLSATEKLEKTVMMERPLTNQWHSVGLYHGSDVEVLMKDSADEGDGGNDAGNANKNGGGGGNNQSSIRSLDIVLRSEGGVDSINKFVNLSYNWYMEELKKKEDNDRYMFDVIYTSSFNGGNTPRYQAYALSDDKTFETLFSKQCHELLGVVNQFQNRSGKYAIKGYPHKLGLLLSGPPGTGKTSLIKALAHHCGRHIVSINLSRVRTNEELMTIFFNKSYQVDSNGHTMRLDYEDVIFVLEDIDASSDVVMDRKLQKPKPKKERPMGPQLSPPNTDGATGSGDAKKSTSLFQGSDDLNLSGILNVLDGVVDTPNRMVIMTSNHPEMLDPALIRPGRIDKILELGYMIDEDIVAMIEHYFQSKMSALQKVQVHKLVEEGLEVTPAQMEQMAVEIEGIDEFLKKLSRVGDGSSKNAPATCSSDEDSEV